MEIKKRELESEEDKSLGSSLDPSVLTFVRILSDKLDQSTIGNLFGKSESPTCNLLVNMLENHKLRSMFDFEKAVSREWNLLKQMNSGDGNEQLSWNFRLLDLAAGKGTAVETVFLLKEAGSFRGAKRRLKFNGEDLAEQPLGSSPADDMSKLVKKMKLDDITPGKSVSRASITLKMSDCSAGWHGNKRSPPKIGTHSANPGRNLKTPKKGHRYGLVGQQGRDGISSSRTPSNTTKGRGGRKQAINCTPARGQSTILQYMSAKKTTSCAVGAAYQDTEEVLVQQTDDVGV